MCDVTAVAFEEIRSEYSGADSVDTVMLFPSMAVVVTFEDAFSSWVTLIPNEGNIISVRLV